MSKNADFTGAMWVGAIEFEEACLRWPSLKILASANSLEAVMNKQDPARDKLREDLILAFWGKQVEVCDYTSTPQETGVLNHYAAECLADAALAVFVSLT
jgi:hypothetical protein